MAFAAATDETGRVGWDVLMSFDSPPIEPRFDAHVSLGACISSRFVEPLPGG